MSALNPHQFHPDTFGTLPRSEDYSDAFGNHETYFHATTPEAAEKIEREGFRLGPERHGQSAGRGLYLHHQEHAVRQYGPITIAAEVPDHVKIHEEPLNDPELLGHASRRARYAGGSALDHMSEIAHEMGYHGHRDPDDGATVVYNPRQVHYLTHYDPDEMARTLGEQFR